MQKKHDNFLRTDLLNALERIKQDQTIDAFSAFEVLRVHVAVSDETLGRALAGAQHALESRTESRCFECLKQSLRL